LGFKHLDNSLRALWVDEIAAGFAHQAGGIHPASLAEAENQPTNADDAAGRLVATELHVDIFEWWFHIRVGDGTEDVVLLDEFARRNAAEGVGRLDAERFGLIEEGRRQAVMALIGRGLVITRQHKQVGTVAVGVDRVELGAGEVGDALVVDGDLWRELVGVDLPDEFAVEFVDQMFGGELADVADAGQAFDQHRVRQLGLGVRHDIDFVHAATGVRAA
jgi:hypothetical protein